MRQIITAAAIALSFAAAAPAAAQIVGRNDYGPVGRGNPFIGDSSLGFPGAGREARGLRREIERGRESGQLSSSEARQLRRETRRFGRVARAFGSDGLSASEASFLHASAMALRGRIAVARTRADAPRRRSGRR